MKKLVKKLNEDFDKRRRMQEAFENECRRKVDVQPAFVVNDTTIWIEPLTANIQIKLSGQWMALSDIRFIKEMFCVDDLAWTPVLKAEESRVDHWMLRLEMGPSNAFLKSFAEKVLTELKVEKKTKKAAKKAEKEKQE